jgi:hypothetical protein
VCPINRQVIVGDIKSSSLRWLGHVERMAEDRAVKKVFKGKPGGRRLQGRPRKRWLDDVDEDLRKMGVRRWRSGLTIEKSGL